VTLGWQLGVAVASGVPILILLSLGPVAALAGPPSVVVWALAALVGMVMAVPFAELVYLFPDQTGGIAVVSAHALRPHSRLLAVLVQWSYWLGWSLGVAVHGILVGGYLQRLLLPGDSPWAAWLIAVAILGVSAFVNRFGIRPGAWFQLSLLACTVAVAGLLLGLPLLTGDVELGHLAPFQPPGGWVSLHTPVALAGAFFIAGWSAYGAEITLTYRAEYGKGPRDVFRCLMLLAGLTVAVYSVVPLVAFVVVGSDHVRGGPVPLLESLSEQGGLVTSLLAPVALVGAFFLTLNMIAIGSSRALWQMARNGEAWAFLGRLNRHGVPGNALVFGFVTNATVLAISLLINDNRGDAPIALLASANVGYFLSLILALVATWMMRRTQPELERPFRSPSGYVGFGLSVAVFNTVLLAGAGAAWGWHNIVLGVVILVVAAALFTPRAALFPTRAGDRSLSLVSSESSP
jgi:amino acid transporter